MPFHQAPSRHLPVFGRCGLAPAPRPCLRGFRAMLRCRILRKIMATITAQERSQQVGDELVSDWVTVSQEMIDKFADASGDHQFIHIDPEKAKLTPFGGTVAHGFLTQSKIPLLDYWLIDAPTIKGVKMGVN